MLRISHFDRQTIKGDVFGALTSTIVALPFALAFGVTSGIGASAGLYCAIITGFFASIFGGTNQQISGPNTGLTIAMVAILTNFLAQSPEHGMALAFTVVSLAGVFQILFGFFKLGKYFTLVSYPVISGFTSGIGVLIILSQFEVLFGQALPEFELSIHSLFNTNTLVGFACLALLFSWPKKYSLIVPASITALTAATLFYVFSGSDIPVIGAISSELPSFSWPIWHSELSIEIIKSAFLIASLSTLDSLMTSLTVDSLSEELHDSDQELVGQGIGNIVAGLFGALPGGGAAMRTVTNLTAGGTTPLSGILHAIFILIIVMWAGAYTAYIPVAVLGAILIHVGFSIIDWKFLKRVHQIPIFSVILMLSTMVMAVALDLITAVVVGVFMANLVTIRRLSEIQLDKIKLIEAKDAKDLTLSEQALLATLDTKLLMLNISGPIGFGVARGLKQIVSKSPQNQTLLIDFRDARFVGTTSTLAIEDIILTYQNQGGRVLLANICPKVQADFDKLQVLQHLASEHVFQTRTDALQYLTRQNA
jgi:sulfate permease, SulP family